MFMDRKLITLLVLTVLVSATSFASNQDAIPGEFIVKLKPGQEKRPLDRLAMAFAANEVRAVTLDHSYIVVRRPMHELSANALSTLNNHPFVAYAEPNYIIKINKTPNDPNLGDLWGMQNSTTEGVDIGALQAWDLSTGSKDVVVAVIDTGINYEHKDLKDNVWTNLAEKNGRPGVDDDNNGYVDDIHGYDFANNDPDPMDDHSHGSHCSGTIGAKGDDGVGVVGVNWNVSIMGVKFLTASGSGSLEGAIQAIDYATKNHADIMSNSWGGGGYMQSLEDAIKRAKDAGILFVAAAGNDSANNDSQPTYPASYNVDNVIAVAAVDSTGALARFSNYGKNSVDIAAPGVDILSSVLNDEYKKYSGTSMATPHVAGVAALLKAYEPSMTYAQIKQRLLATTRPLSSLRGKTQKGLVNAFNALTNQSGGVDPNDPESWTKADFSLVSPSPYENNFSQTYEVEMPGAKKIAVFFSTFKTEYRFDTVVFKDAAGTVLGVWSGDNSQTWSPIAEGDKITLEFTSDTSIVDQGFAITKIGYKADQPSEPQQPTPPPELEEPIPGQD